MKLKNLFIKFSYTDFLLRRFFVALIKFYQKTISFDHSFFKIFYPHGFCRFSPSCSDYAILSIEKYGIIKGGLKASWRIIRCNPWNKGGYDPLK